MPRISKKLKAAVFIDGANLFFAEKDAGWFIDYQKLKKHLASQYRLIFLCYYNGFRPKEKKKMSNFFNVLKRFGYQVKTKPVKRIYDQRNKKYTYKCNFDAEIVLDTMLNLDKADVIILVSGDSDFLCLLQHLSEIKKKFFVYSFRKNIAWEIKKQCKYGCYCFLENVKEQIIES